MECDSLTLEAIHLIRRFNLKKTVLSSAHSEIVRRKVATFSESRYALQPHKQNKRTRFRTKYWSPLGACALQAPVKRPASAFKESTDLISNEKIFKTAFCNDSALIQDSEQKKRTKHSIVDLSCQRNSSRRGSGMLTIHSTGSQTTFQCHST